MWGYSGFGLSPSRPEMDARLVALPRGSAELKVRHLFSSVQFSSVQFSSVQLPDNQTSLNQNDC